MELRHNGHYIYTTTMCREIVLQYHQNLCDSFNKLCNFYCAKNGQSSSQRDKLGCTLVSNSLARVGAACVGSTMVGPETRHGVRVRGQDVLQALSRVYETKWKLQKMDINDTIQKPFI